MKDWFEIIEIINKVLGLIAFVGAMVLHFRDKDSSATFWMSFAIWCWIFNE